MDAAGVYKSANTPYLKSPEQLRNIVVEKPGDFDRLMKIAMQAAPFIPQELKVAQEKLMITQSKNTHKMVSTLVEMSKLYTPESFAMATRMNDAAVRIGWGKDDQVINVEVAQELHGLFKKSDVPLILNGVGHMPILEAEQLVVQPYLKFLNTIK